MSRKRKRKRKREREREREREIVSECVRERFSHAWKREILRLTSIIFLSLSLFVIWKMSVGRLPVTSPSSSLGVTWFCDRGVANSVADM